MNFTTVRDALKTIITTDAGSDFRVLGYKNEPEASSNVLDTNASVSVYFSEAKVSPSKSAHICEFAWDCIYNIELMIATSAKADLTTLNDSGSTDGERATALSNVENTRLLADEALDSLIEKVFSIIMDGDNLDLGLSVGVARSRFINEVIKLDPLYGNYSDLIICKAKMNLYLELTETVSGDEGTEGEIIDLTLNIDDEPTDGQAGIYED